VLHFPVSRPLRGGFVLYFLSVGPSVEVLYCNFYQSAPLRRLCTALSISRSLAEALDCSFYQSAPPWRLFTAISIGGPLRRVLHLLPSRLCTAFSISQTSVEAFYYSRPLRGGFILHFLSVGPSMEALYCTFYQSAPRGGFILHFMLAGPSVEVLYCTFYYSALSASYFTFYQSAPSWRPCTTLPSVGLCRGFVLYSVAVRHDDEKICPRETLFTHHFGPLC